LYQSSLSEELPAPEAIVRALEEGGVRFVLGMPGGLTLALWAALHSHPTIRAIQVREESIGAAMAEAYGRDTAEPAVVMGQGEWIVGNAGQAYMEALLGSSPLVILTEMSDGGPLSHHAPYQSGSGDYGTWNARSALAAVTKRVMVSYSPAQAVQHTQLAIKHALTGEPGPVAVVYHSNALYGQVGPGSLPLIYPTRAYLPRKANAFDEHEVKAAADALCNAARPVIIAGNGVRLSKGQESLARLAQAIGAPVVTSASGKGVYTETDPLYAGVMGPFGWAAANAVVGESDVILAVGTKLAPTDTINEHRTLLDPSRQLMIQVDVEPLNASWTMPMDRVLIGDAAEAMDRLTAVCRDGNSCGHRAQADRARARVDDALKRHGPWYFADDAGLDEIPLTPQRIISTLQETFPEDGAIACDAGENRLFMQQWFRSSSKGSYLQPAAGGGMGYSVPAAMAAKLAKPERPALAVCGDGGFAMCLHALMTAVQENLPVGVLVLNNGALGWVLHGMGEKGVAANFKEFDHAAIARSIGCDGVRVTSSAELYSALKSIHDLTRTFVIDVPTSLSTSFRDVAHSLVGEDYRRAGY
jgi:acetolactate synthase I/II/III large subunit